MEHNLKCDHVGRMSGDERREQILNTAVELFSQHGFKGTTTKQIAAAAGVSEAMVFRHFATKDELYAAIINSKACSDGTSRFPWDGNTAVLQAIEKNDDHAFFSGVALAALDKHQEDVAFMRLLIYSALEEHDLAERFFHEFVEEVYEFIGGYIAKRQKDGAFRRMDPRVAVRSFLGMLIHHSLNNILWDKKRKILDIPNETAAGHFADILLRGIRAEATEAKDE
jgi:AcrR family transcriptional regulator